MSEFCKNLEQIVYDQSKLNDQQKDLYQEWDERCLKNNFNFSNQFALFHEQSELIKVSCQEIVSFLHIRSIHLDFEGHIAMSHI